MDIAPGNQDAIEAWNGILFDKFVAYRPIVSDGLGAHGERALALFPPAPGARALDVGCGFGDTAVRIGELVGPAGSVIGVDAAARFIDVAKAEAERAGWRNVRFAVADVEASLPDGPFDFAYSRFGTMFFGSPVRALRNVKAALVDGGRLVMTVWRRKDANEAFYLAENVVRDLLGDPPKNDQPTCGPGPFSMASADVTSDILKAAGFRDIAFARCDLDILIGRSVDDAIGFAMTLGPAGEVVRLAGAAAIERKPEIEAGLRAALAPLVRSDGVWAPSSSWTVTARA
jgi:SAM-dependent methyltransferase